MLALAIGLLAIASTPARAAAAQVDGRPTLAVYHLTAGWATFGLVLPAGEAFDAVRVGNLDTQTDVKSRWPDHSIKSAVVSANVPSAGHYAITSADAEGGEPFSPNTFPPIVVEFTTVEATPTVYRAVFAAGQDTWLSGPLVREARFSAAPSALGAQNNLFGAVRVIFDVRSYASGGHRVDVTVENSLDIPTADAVRYDVKIFVGGAPKFAKADVFHRYLARWRQVVTTTGLVESQVTPDFAPFVRAHALPNYLPTVDNVARAITAADPEIPNVLLPEFEILQVGFLARPMEAHSGRPELAPYPDWAAQAIVHRQRGQLDFALKNGELAGSWGVHIRNGNGNLISIDQRPGFWLDHRADPGNGPANGLLGRATQATIEGDPTSGTAGDIAHQPSLAYLPYLITGDRYFLDEVSFWANYTLIGTFQDSAQNLRGGGKNPDGTPVFSGSRGLIVFNEVRGIGWGLRNIADAAFILPDGDPLKAYFTQKVNNNLLWLDDYAEKFQSGPLGAMFPYRRPEGREQGNYAPYAWISMWEQSYVGWAVDRARRILDMAEGEDFLRRLAAFDLKLFTSAPDFDPDWAGIYLVAIGEHSTTPLDFNTDVITYFDTIKKVFDVSSSATKTGAPAIIGDFYREFEGFYGTEHRLLLMIARGLGLEGAQEAYDSLMAHADTIRPAGGGNPGGETMIHDLNERSGWAIGLGGVTPLLSDIAPGRPTLLINAAPITTSIQ